MTARPLKDAAWAALRRVDDPCSVATRSPLNIVDMGLVREVAVDAKGNVEVSISPTAPSCMLLASISEAARRELESVEGVGEIGITVDVDFFWTPEAMTEEGRAELQRHRDARRGEAPVPLGRLRRRAAA